MASENTNAESHPRVVRLFGNRDSAEAWAIRDFLKRSVVEFEWTDRSDHRRSLTLIG
jgi:thioredoxin reductase (NADPH)